MRSPKTSVSSLAVVVAVMAAAGWALAKLWPTWTQTQLVVPTLTPIVMSGLAVFLVAWTLMVRIHLKGASGRNRLEPVVAARSAALALSSSRVGSIALGFYGGVLLLNALTLDTEASHRCVRITSATVVASFVVLVVGLWLERICRLPNNLDKAATDAGHA